MNVDIKTSPSVEAFKSKLNNDVKSPSKYFSMGNRKINIIMAKLRMNCSNLNSDLFRIKVIANSNCKCGYHNETVFHYLFECRLYIAIRGTMHEDILNIPNAKFDTRNLLYGTDNDICKDFWFGINIYKQIQTFLR